MDLLKAILITGFIFAICNLNSVQTEKNVFELASETNDLSSMVSAIQAAGLADTLQGEGTYTIFAPSNEAFRNLPDGRLNELMLESNKSELTELVAHHIITGRVTSADLNNEWKARTIGGKEITISISDNNIQVDKATVIRADMLATNGIIHIIDQVLVTSDEDD